MSEERGRSRLRNYNSTERSDSLLARKRMARLMAAKNGKISTEMARHQIRC